MYCSICLCFCAVFSARRGVSIPSVYKSIKKFRDSKRNRKVFFRNRPSLYIRASDRQPRRESCSLHSQAFVCRTPRAVPSHTSRRVDRAERMPQWIKNARVLLPEWIFCATFERRFAVRADCCFASPENCYFLMSRRRHMDAPTDRRVHARQRGENLSYTDFTLPAWASCALYIDMGCSRPSGEYIA